MEKIYVNKDACIGCGACVAIDPEHFDFDDDGLSHAISNDNIESEDLKSAISSCPVGAISVSECDCGCDKDNCNCDSNCNCGCNK